MERIMRLITVLNSTQSAVPTERLIRVGDYRADADSAKRMLNRDLDQLNRQGWDIRNVAEPGEPGRYQLFARDNRLQVQLSPAQRAELVRAATAMDRPEYADLLGIPAAQGNTSARVVRVAAPKALDTVLRAVSLRCRLRFVYKDTPREADPHAVHPGPSGWYLRAREVNETRVKEFVIERMRGVIVGKPATAEAVVDVPRPQLDPLTWQYDPPLEVALETSREHRSLVEQLLGEPTEVAEVSAAGPLRMTYNVTHRAAFRWRVYELGMRVRVLGPESLRDEMRAELEEIMEMGL